MNRRTLTTLRHNHHVWIALEDASRVTSAEIPPAGVSVIGRSARRGDVIYVAFLALFLSLGIVWPVGLILTMPPWRFRIRRTTRGEILPRQYGICEGVGSARWERGICGSRGVETVAQRAGECCPRWLPVYEGGNLRIPSEELPRTSSHRSVWRWKRLSVGCVRTSRST